MANSLETDQAAPSPSDLGLTFLPMSCQKSFISKF